MSEASAYRHGHCDGILGRTSQNPYYWDKPFSMLGYNQGFAKGRKSRIEDGITLIFTEYTK